MRPAGGWLLSWPVDLILIPVPACLPIVRARLALEAESNAPLSPDVANELIELVIRFLEITDTLTAFAQYLVGQPSMN